MFNIYFFFFIKTRCTDLKWYVTVFDLIGTKSAPGNGFSPLTDF